LRQVKAHADGLGLELEVGLYSICETSTSFSNRRGSAVQQLSAMLHVGEVLGCKAVRTLLGSNADRRTPTPLATHVQNTIATLKAVRDQAMDLGIKIAIENHAGDLLGRELKALVEEAGPEFVGVCIDSGNPLWMGESPYVTLQHVAPYVLMSHIRDTVVCPHPKGAAVQWVAMGDGTIDIARWSKLYQEQCANTNFTLEIISTLAPKVLNYLEPEYWNVYPDLPAAEFAQFLQLVQNGSPYTQPALTSSWADLSPTVKAALALEQQRQLEKSVTYCRDVLQIGV
jgi:sugar phosphate isomerase/epimerase